MGKQSWLEAVACTWVALPLRLHVGYVYGFLPPIRFLYLYFNSFRVLFLVYAPFVFIALFCFTPSRIFRLLCFSCSSGFPVIFYSLAILSFPTCFGIPGFLGFLPSLDLLPSYIFPPSLVFTALQFHDYLLLSPQLDSHLVCVSRVSSFNLFYFPSFFGFSTFFDFQALLGFTADISFSSHIVFFLRYFPTLCCCPNLLSTLACFLNLELHYFPLSFAFAGILLKFSYLSVICAQVPSIPPYFPFTALDFPVPCHSFLRCPVFSSYPLEVLCSIQLSCVSSPYLSATFFH